MAVSAYWYGGALLSSMNKEADWDSDTIKCLLATSSYTPNQDSHRYKSDISGEVSGTGYTAGGVTLATPTQSYTGSTNVWALDAGDAQWTGASFTARYAVVYDATPATDATRPLLCYVDFGGDQTVNGANFTVQWDSGGIVKITIS
jgi:hypothetical protein